MVYIDLANSIIKDASSDYDRLLKINDWVASNIYYNWDAYLAGVNVSSNAPTTLVNKRAVCIGYAVLTQELLRAVKIPSRLVIGHALQANSWAENDHTATHKRVKSNLMFYII